ncbi:MAG: rhodanese-like domain-containing protein [Clostridiales bacterium]|jgi:rhodanese-related sulfurtransferase|nr:rhodanese-like domain-containing protein [Clostridiales bacterium]
MNRKDYLQAVCDSQISPTEVFMKQCEDPGFYYVVDVRIGPKEFKGEKIAGAAEIPLSELPRKLNALPRDKKIAVVTWGVQCTLAKQASLMLLNAGYDAVEIGGGVAAWKEARLPVEPVA